MNSYKKMCFSSYIFQRYAYYSQVGLKLQAGGWTPPKVYTSAHATSVASYPSEVFPSCYGHLSKQKYFVFHHIVSFTIFSFSTYFSFISFLCRAWTFQLSEHLKKWMNHVFVLILPIRTKKYFFSLAFSLFFLSYLTSSLNLCDEYYFSYINKCHKSG